MRCGCTRRPTWAGIPAPSLSALGARGHVSRDIEALARELARALRPGDHVLVMSNGGFGGLHGKLLAELRREQ